MNPNRILLIRPDAIGDVVLMGPLINTLAKTFPKAEIVTLQQSYTAALFKPHPNVADVIVDWRRLGTARGIRGFFAYAKYLRSQAFDMVFLPFLEPYYLALCIAAGIPIRVGDANKILLRPFLTHPVPLHFRQYLLHETEQNIVLLNGLGVPVDVDLDMRVYSDPADDTTVLAKLEAQGWDYEPLVLIHPTTGGGNRAWLPTYYAQLIDGIQAQTTRRVVLTGHGTADAAVLDTIRAEASSTFYSLLGKTSLGELKSLIARCDVVVGTDTGPTHIAAAMQRPVLCISPTKFVKSLRWGPWQTVNDVVSKPHACPYICNPYLCKEVDCLTALQVNDVLDALMRLLDRREPLSVGDLYRRNKRHWFVRSVNPLLLVTEPDSQDGDSVISVYQGLKSLGFQPRVCILNSQNRSRLDGKVDKEDMLGVSGPWLGLRSVIKRLAVWDINFIHVFGSTPGKFWQKIVFHGLSLQLYSPPFFMPNMPVDTDLIDLYMAQVSRQYNQSIASRFDML